MGGCDMKSGIHGKLLWHKRELVLVSGLEPPFKKYLVPVVIDNFPDWWILREVMYHNKYIEKEFLEDMCSALTEHLTTHYLWSVPTLIKQCRSSEEEAYWKKIGCSCLLSVVAIEM
jgi:hypothetical protein